jgi:hypothetical protein
MTKNGITRNTGWITDGKTRPLIANEFIDWITVDERWEKVKIYSSRLLEEIRTWVWENQKAIHAQGAHDDLIMAMALCLYNRNLADAAGESFLVTNEGKVITGNIQGKDNLKKEVKFTDLYFDEKSDDEKEIYKWLTS